MCLKTVSRSAIKPPRPVPVQIWVKHREIGPGEIGFGIAVKPLSMEEVGCPLKS